MINYGFRLIDRIEAQELGFPEGSGSFSELYLNMVDEVKKNKKLENDYGDALKMNAFEKRISFLNRYFIYKKIGNVNVENVQLDLDGYIDTTDIKETKNAIQIATEEVKILKPKIKKLNTKLLLTPATEAIDEEETVQTSPPVGLPEPPIEEFIPEPPIEEFIPEPGVEEFIPEPQTTIINKKPRKQRVVKDPNDETVPKNKTRKQRVVT